MKKVAPIVLAALLAILLATTITACTGKTNIGLVSDIGKTRTNPLSSDGKIGDFPAEEIKVDGYHVYYVEATVLESDPGENPDALDSAKAAWGVAEQSLGGTLNTDKNFFLSLRSVELLNDEDHYTYTLGLGTGYEKSDYVVLYDLAVNYTGDVLFLSNESGTWEPFGN
ncbi:MAG: hypothetical protein FWE94_04510 [Coriobacteriia bacterium]|nr:hypothetical protein [Coriobacteriia bacterium]